MIKEEEIEYPEGSPLSFRIYSVEHYHVHFHSDSLELILCLEGSVFIQNCSETRKLTAGQIYSIDMPDIHHLYSEEPNVIVSFYIRLSPFYSRWPELRHIWFACNPSNLSPVKRKALERIEELVLFTVYRTVSGETQAVTEAEKSALEILQLLIDYFNYYYFNKDAVSHNPDTIRRFNRIISYCQENYRNKITLSDIAENENLNKFYISQLLRNSSFDGFSRVLGYIRCLHAVHLLLTTEDSIEQISGECGFSDLKYFYRQFREWWKCTPNEFRIRHEEYLNEPEIFSDVNEAEVKTLLGNYILSRMMIRWSPSGTIQP